MAYMSFTPWETDTAGSTGPAIATAGDAALFSSLELRVISLGARSDISRERAPASRIGRLLEDVLGLKPDRPLASPRLERLRRYASLIRHHPDRIGEKDTDELISAGFSKGQVYGLLHYLTDHHPRANRSARA